MNHQLPLVVGVFGPTSCRKSEFALEAAERFGGEIINCDSVQVYKKVQIGANKPTPDEYKRAQHHLFDFVEPPDVYTAGRFHEDFHRVVKEQTQKGIRIFYLVGGSNFYARAALKGLYPVEASTPERRQMLQGEWEEDAGETLFQELAQRDPDYAKKIGHADQKRVIRAMEILRFNGIKNMAELEQNLKSQPKNFRTLQLAFYKDREDLRQKITQRTEQMIERGLIEEVKALLQEGLKNWAPLGSVGYVEVVSYLEGKLSRAELVGEIAKNTARLAKRQMTWLRSVEEVQWIHAERDWSKAFTLVEKEI